MAELEAVIVGACECRSHPASAHCRRSSILFSDYSESRYELPQVDGNVAVLEYYPP
jgi:hypothetical protein